MADEQRENIQILLVEDYPTNQDVAMLILTQAGYQVDLAGDGQEAINAFKQKKYDLVLMDIQMPLKDGYEATREIRATESVLKKENPGVRTTPIIAMTAHALIGYREKCLLAGMDDYLTKPLKRKALIEMVDKWSRIKNRDRAIFSEISPQAHKLSEDKTEQSQDKHDISMSGIPVSDIRKDEEKNDAPINYEEALEEFGGNRTFLDKALASFPRLVREQLKWLRKALENGDAATIMSESHKIKGGAANLTAIRLSSASERLEQTAREENLESAGELIDLVERELQDVDVCIKLNINKRIIEKT